MHRKEQNNAPGNKKQENKTAQLEANINNLEIEGSHIEKSTDSHEKEKRPDIQMRKMFKKLGELSDFQRNQSEEIELKESKTLDIATELHGISQNLGE